MCMMKNLIKLLAMLTATAIGMPVLAQPSPRPPSRTASEPSPLDEIITLGRTQPIPVEKAPKGCVVLDTAKYCRPDGLPIASVRVLEERTLGLSSVKAPRIESGCVLVDMSLGVPVSKTAADRCEGGEAKVSIKLQVTAR